MVQMSYVLSHVRFAEESAMSDLRSVTVGSAQFMSQCV